jgi:hypothetical protein
MLRQQKKSKQGNELAATDSVFAGLNSAGRSGRDKADMRRRLCLGRPRNRAADK